MSTTNRRPNGHIGFLDIKDAIKHSPVEFIRRVLTEPDGTHSEPHIGQIDLLLSIVADTVIVAGRQWGKSKVMGWYIAWWALRFAYRHAWIVAPTLDQARIIFNEVARVFRAYPLKVMVAKQITEFPFPEIILINGTRIHARGANSPQYIRGQPAHLIIEDESAFIKEGVHSNVIEPMLTVTGKMEGSGIIRISTPFGQGEFFDGATDAQKHTDAKGRSINGKSVYKHYTSLDNPHADKERLLAIRDRVGEDSLLWQTEYLGNFAASDMAVFSWADIKYAYEHFPSYTKEGALSFPVARKESHRYAQGVDLANRRDYFVSATLDATDPLYSPMVRIDRLQQRGYAAYKSIIRSNYSAYNSSPTLIDATSLGESVVEDLRDINAEGYTYTSTSKYDIVHNLVRMFNEHRIGIPYIKEVIDELRFFEYTITPSKTVKMEAKGSGHDDIVMATALAGQLASRPSYTGFFMGVDMDAYGKPYQKKLPLDYTPKDDE